MLSPTEIPVVETVNIENSSFVLKTQQDFAPESPFKAVQFLLFLAVLNVVLISVSWVLLPFLL
jgi:hypothetical protein